MKIEMLVVLVMAVTLASLPIGCRASGGQTETVKTFEECAAAGYAILESYPRQCRTPDGTLFVEDIGNTVEKLDLIRLSNPRPNEAISGPLVIKGEARGMWFFEADFPIKLLDENDKVLATAIARAKGEWMTEEFVPFEARLEFSSPLSDRGTLVLEKDNPSGLAEHADELRIPVLFENP